MRRRLLSDADALRLFWKWEVEKTKAELPPNTAKILAFLARHADAVDIQAIIDGCLVSAQQVSRFKTFAMARGWVSRTTNRTHRSYGRLSLTTSGRNAIGDLIHAAQTGNSSLPKSED